MNDNQGINSNNNSYKATSNLNTAIDNPTIDVNNLTSVNIQNNESVNGVNIQNNELVNSVNIQNNQSVNDDNILNNESINSFNSVSTGTTDINSINYNKGSSVEVTNNSVGLDNSGLSVNLSVNESDKIKSSNYEGVYEKKEPSIVSTNKGLSKELKLIIFIVFLLMIFLLFLPTLFNWFQRLIILITTSR